MINSDRDKWLKMDDAELLGLCRCDFFIGSGRGGQKRNKTSNAVRLVHEPTSIIVTDCSGRSRDDNRHKALKKLRLQLALEVRTPEPSMPERLDTSINHKNYPLLAAALIDQLYVVEFKVSEAAATLEISTGALIKQLSRSPALWQAVNRQREKHNLKPLKQ
jgi:RF-1 domain